MRYHRSNRGELVSPVKEMVEGGDSMRKVAAMFMAVAALGFLSACGRDETITSTTDTIPPLPPVDLRVFDARDGSVVLFWSSGKEVDLAGYRVYRAVQSEPDSFRYVGETTQAVYVDDGLEYDTTYLYSVTAFDQSGNESERSNVVSAMPVNEFPPRQPGGFRVQAHNRDDGVFISLLWDANNEGDLQGYYIYRSTDEPVYPLPEFLHDSTSSTMYRDTAGVEVGKDLYYEVAAYDKGRLQSAPTPIQGDRPLDKPGLVLPADGGASPGYPTFYWHPVPGALGYVIFVSTSRFSGEIWSAALADTVAPYSGSILTPGTVYYWKVGTITNTPWDPNSLSAVWSFQPG